MVIRLSYLHNGVSHQFTSEKIDMKREIDQTSSCASDIPMNIVGDTKSQPVSKHGFDLVLRNICQISTHLALHLILSPTIHDMKGKHVYKITESCRVSSASLYGVMYQGNLLIREPAPINSLSGHLQPPPYLPGDGHRGRLTHWSLGIYHLFKDIVFNLDVKFTSKVFLQSVLHGLIIVNIGPSNGLVLDSTKSLPELMLTTDTLLHHGQWVNPAYFES